MFFMNNKSTENTWDHNLLRISIFCSYMTGIKRMYIIKNVIHVWTEKKILNLKNNNRITIVNTFWFTELIFELFLSHEVSMCVSET